MGAIRTFFIFFLTFITTCYCVKRTLHHEVNPGCGDICKNYSVILGHVSAIGPNDTLHYVWDFTGNPSVLLAVTSLSAKLIVHWEALAFQLINSPVIKFTEEPIYSFGIAFERLIEFNDINDDARLNVIDEKNVDILHLQNFKWQLQRNSTMDDNLVSIEMIGDSYNNTAKNDTRHGSIKFTIHSFGLLNRSEISPYMLHSENSSQIDIVLDNLQTNKNFSNSRFAMEFVFMGDGEQRSMHVEEKRNLDDEHTPGVFEIMELSTSPLMINRTRQEPGLYLLWRPVSFVEPIRDVTNSVDAVYYNPMNITKRNLNANDTLLHMYYGNRLHNILAQNMNVSIGTKGDGYYNKTNYATWTFIIGYGTPPEEVFSNLVIMIIVIGVGLPFILILAMGLYSCICKLKNRPTNEFHNS